MKQMFENVCENSSLHGLHYLVNRKKTIPERVFWALLLTLSMFILVTQVLLQLIALQISTVLAVVENPHYDLSENEFPAITVCPNINVMDSKVQSMVRRYNLSETNHSSFRNTLIALSLMRFAYFNLPQDYINLVNGNIYPIKDDDIERTMFEVKPDLDTIIDSCSWKSKRVDCKRLFHLQIMLEGFCYSFNSKTAVKSTQDTIELSPLVLHNMTFSGFRTSMFGKSSGLGFRLKSLAHDTLNNTLFGDYYNIYIHNPSLIPDMSKVFTVPSDNPFNRNYIRVSVSVVEASNFFTIIEESSRGCQFDNGTTIFSCSLECRISSILKNCNCLPYYLHHLVLESEVCGLRHLQCLSNLAEFFRTYGVPKGTPGFPHWVLLRDTHCSCLQLCSYIAYTAKLKVGYKQINNIDRGWTRVDIFYDSFATKYSRTPSYLLRDFLVSFGSFANLLLGFSAVAVVDFSIYFCKFVKRFLIELCAKRSDAIRIRKPTRRLK